MSPVKTVSPKGTGSNLPNPIFPLPSLTNLPSMKLTLFLAILLLTCSAYCQENNLTSQVGFPKQSFKDSSVFATGISELAEDIISVYSNKDLPGYYNDVFRIAFAKNDFQRTVQSLDSFSILVVPDAAYRNAPGFYYRVFSRSMINKKQRTDKNFEELFNQEFASLYSTLPDDAKEQVAAIFEKADIQDEKQKFIDLVKKFEGNDSITISEGLSLIKQWNFWQVYQKTGILANKQIAAFQVIEKANEEKKRLGLDEGAVPDDNAQTFITNVNLVDVENKKLIPNTNVGIKGNLISIISARKITIPANAKHIDGTGQYLVPGLTDAHIHFFQSGGLYTRPDGLDLRKYMPYEKEIEFSHINMKDVLKRNLINGITTVVDVGASYNLLELRDKYKGKSFAPQIYMTGPLLTTSEPSVFSNLGKDAPFSLVTTEEEGRKMVHEQLPYHPDFIKIWYILDEGDKEKSAKKYLPIIKAIIDESHKNHLKVAVHATERITAQLSVENGCDYLVHSVDDEVINDDLVKAIKEKKVILCPTLTVYSNYLKTYAQELDFSPYELKNANPVQIGSLYDLKHIPEQAIINSYKTGARAAKLSAAKQDSICMVNLKKLSDAGVIIVSGTDAGNIATMHGTSLLPELKQMERSGMSNWQVLQSATINAAYLFNKEKQTGSIAKGKLADMVLLKANPVENLENLEKISLVFNKGFAVMPDTLIKETALALVQRQLNAYNARNLEAFLEPYSDDIELYQFPDSLLSRGKEAMRKDYAFLNNLPDLHCEIKERIIQGNIIIDKESVTGVGSTKPVEATAIYHIEANKIRKVYFIQ